MENYLKNDIEEMLVRFERLRDALGEVNDLSEEMSRYISECNYDLSTPPTVYVYKDDYKEGYAEGYDKGKEDGKADGYKSGYNSGVSDGYDKALSNRAKYAASLNRQALFNELMKALGPDYPCDPMRVRAAIDRAVSKFIPNPGKME